MQGDAEVAAVPGVVQVATSLHISDDWRDCSSAISYNRPAQPANNLQ